MIKLRLSSTPLDAYLFSPDSLTWLQQAMGEHSYFELRLHG